MSVEFVICGLEHTGTTLISDLFRQVPHIDAGFEVGVLLRTTPAEFLDLKPFSTNMLSGWKITQADLESCCAAPTHAEFYARLQAASQVLTPGTTMIFDKTPRYLSQLDGCLDRCDRPFIASFKDPRGIVFSDFKRAKTEDFDGWYAEYLPGKRSYIRSCYGQYTAAKSNPRVMFVPLEKLAMDARNMMEAMFAHVGQTFALDYVVMKGLRYQNTRSKVVSADIAFEAFQNLRPGHLKRIEKDFAEFADWFYH